MLLALTLSVLTAVHPDVNDTQALARDSLQTDTLREVTVRAGRVLNVDSFPLHGGKLGADIPIAPPNFADIMEKLIPGFNDKATHPFAIKQRKHERRHKRAMRALEEMDRVRTFDELLREAYERQMLEDSLGTSK